MDSYNHSRTIYWTVINWEFKNYNHSRTFIQNHTQASTFIKAMKINYWLTLKRRDIRIAIEIPKTRIEIQRFQQLQFHTPTTTTTTISTVAISKTNIDFTTRLELVYLDIFLQSAASRRLVSYYHYEFATVSYRWLKFATVSYRLLFWATHVTRNFIRKSITNPLYSRR